ncbi:MAG: formylglycine-generating enzyme family protein [Pirellulaceae bacterium]
MKKNLVWRFVAAMAVLAGSGSVVGAAQRVADPSPAQQTAPQEPATPSQQPATPPETAAPQEPAAPEQQAAAEKSGRPVVEKNSIGMTLVLIPSGEFQMGSPGTEVGRDDDEQAHRVRITKSFHLAVHEVTQSQYESVMAVNPSHFKGPQHPVATVSWDNAVEFCDKLSALPEEKAAGRSYCLPTEAEWEYACRAGSTTQFSFGDDAAELGNHAWFKDNSAATTHPVGEKRPNAWGLYDMHGNVLEWCADWFGEYSASPADDPTGPSTGTDRVTRGGSWDYAASLCRAADRDKRLPGVRNLGLGFRVAAVPLADRRVQATPAVPGTPARGAKSESR